MVYVLTAFGITVVKSISIVELSASRSVVNLMVDAMKPVGSGCEGTESICGLVGRDGVLVVELDPSVDFSVKGAVSVVASAVTLFVGVEYVAFGVRDIMS